MSKCQKNLAAAVLTFLFALSARAAIPPLPLPLPIPGPVHPIPGPTPTLPPMVCPIFNPTPANRTPLESGKPAFIFPDDTHLGFTAFLESLVDGTTVYVRAGNFNAYTDLHSGTVLHRLHLIGSGTAPTKILGFLRLSRASTVAHLSFNSPTAGLPSLEILGAGAVVKNVRVDNGGGVAIGVRPDPRATGITTAPSTLDCVSVNHVSGGGILLGNVLHGVDASGSTLSHVEAIYTNLTEINNNPAVGISGNHATVTDLRVVSGLGGVRIAGDNAIVTRANLSGSQTFALWVEGNRATLSQVAVALSQIGVFTDGEDNNLNDITVSSVEQIGIEILGQGAHATRLTVDGVTNVTGGEALAVNTAYVPNVRPIVVTNSLFKNARVGIEDHTNARALTVNGITFENISFRNIEVLPH